MLVFPIGLFASPASGPPAWVIDPTATFDMDFENARYWGAQPSDLVSGALPTASLITDNTVGTIFVKAQRPSTPFSDYHVFFAWKDSAGSSTPYLNLYCLSGTSNIRSEYVSPGVVVSTTVDIPSAGATIKHAIGWNTSNFEVCENGGTVSTGTARTFDSAMSRMWIAQDAGGGLAFPNGRSATGIQRIAYIPSFSANRVQTITA